MRLHHRKMIHLDKRGRIVVDMDLKNLQMYICAIPQVKAAVDTAAIARRNFSTMYVSNTIWTTYARIVSTAATGSSAWSCLRIYAGLFAKTIIIAAASTHTGSSAKANIISVTNMHTISTNCNLEAMTRLSWSIRVHKYKTALLVVSKMCLLEFGNTVAYDGLLEKGPGSWSEFRELNNAESKLSLKIGSESVMTKKVRPARTDAPQ